MSDVTETFPSVEQSDDTSVDTKVGIADLQQIIHVVENVVTVESSEMSLACPEESANTVDCSNAENPNIQSINIENTIIADVVHDVTEAGVGATVMQYAGQMHPGNSVIQLAAGSTIQTLDGNEVEVVAIISPDGEDLLGRPEPGVFEQTVVADQPDGEVPGQTIQIIASESNPQIIATQDIFSGAQWKLSETGNPRSILRSIYKTDTAPVHLVTTNGQDAQVVAMVANTQEAPAVSMTDEGTSTDQMDIAENAQPCMTDEATDQRQVAAEEDGNVEKYTITIQEASDVQMAEFMRSEMNNINMNELSEEDISLLKRRIDGQIDARPSGEGGDEAPMVTRIIKLPQGTPGAAETLCILSSPETTDPAMIEKMVKAFLASSMGIDVNKSPASPPTIIMSNELDLPATNAKISRSSETVNKIVQCPICDKIIAHRNNLQTHIKTHTGEKPFVCGVCNKTFSRKGNLQTHARTHTGLKPFKCNICAKTFCELGHLKKHARMHTGEKPFPCELCDRMFSQKYSLKSHMIAHSGLKEFVCSYCKKEFCHKGSLQKHVRNHTGNKPHTCSICKKRFAIMTYLKIHMTTHTGLKPFPCQLCDKRFAQKSNLQAHMKGHNGIKPFNCNACDKTFAQKCHLLRHLMTHDPDTKVKREKDILPCPVCQREFRNKASFDKHVSRHDSAFCCDECGKLYANQVSFDKHSKRCAERVKCEACNKEFPNQSALGTHAKKHCSTECKEEDDESDKISTHDEESVTSNQDTDLEQLNSLTNRKPAESEDASMSEDEQRTTDSDEGERDTEDAETKSQETEEGTEVVARKRRKVAVDDAQDVERNELSDKGTRPEANADNIVENGTASINTSIVKIEDGESEPEEKIVSAASTIVHPHFTRRTGRKPARFDTTPSPDAPASKSPRSTSRKLRLLDATGSPDTPSTVNKSPHNTVRKPSLLDATSSTETPTVVNKSPRSITRKPPLLDAVTSPDSPAAVNRSPRRTVSSDVSLKANESRHVASSVETSAKAKKSPKNLEEARPPTRTSLRRMEKLKTNDKKITSKTVIVKSSKSMVSAKKAVVGKTIGNKGQSKFLSQINLRKQSKK